MTNLKCEFCNVEISKYDKKKHFETDEHKKRVNKQKKIDAKIKEIGNAEKSQNKDVILKLLDQIVEILEN